MATTHNWQLLDTLSRANTSTANTPLVSILIPVHNAAKWIGAALESCFRQTYSNIEIVVADDCSTDNTVEVLEQYRSRILYLPTTAGAMRGACAARNRALHASHGDYVQFLDADDMLVASKLEHQLPMLRADEADCVLSQGCIVDSQGNPRGGQEDPYPFDAEADPFVYSLRYGFQTSLALHRRETLLNVGGFRAGLPRGQDLDLQLRLAASGARFGIVNERLVQLRVHEGQTMSGKKWPAHLMLRLFSSLAMELQLTNQITPERGAALASQIHRYSIFSYRQGSRAEARVGFALANQLSSSYPYEERRWVKTLAKVVSPYNTEVLLQKARELRFWK